jgi:hypothetical protein
VISNVSPSFAIQNSHSTVTLNGREFMPETVGVFNGEVIPTDYISDREIKVTLTPRQTAEPGSFLLGAQTPAPGGGQAVPVEFIVDYKDSEE